MAVSNNIDELKSEWQERIILAQKDRKEWMEQFQVELGRAYFEGKQKPPHVPDHDWITLNMVYSHLMGQLPALYSVDPYFYVNLKRSYSPDPNQIAQFEEIGKTRQHFLNYLKGELNLKPKARLGIQDAHFAYGVMKVFYMADLKENPKAGKPLVDENGKKLKDENGEVMVEPDTVPVNGRYEVKRVHPDNFLFDCDSGPLDDSWNWVGEEFSLKMREVRTDKRFSQEIVKQIESKLKGQKRKESKRTRNIEEESVPFTEIYDIKQGEWMIYCEFANELAMKPRKIPAAVENHPYCVLRFVLRDKSALPIPPISQGLEPQKEYNQARSDIMVHRKRFNRKYEVNENMLSDPDAELSKLESGEDGALIRVKQTGAIKSIDTGTMDPQRYSELAALKNDMVELLGSSEQTRGISGADSATEASIIDAKMQIKEGDRLSMVVDWLTQIARKIDMLVQAHIQEDEAVYIEGPEGKFWANVKAQDYEQVKGEFQYSVNIGATQPRLPHIERSQWIAFMSQVVLPMPAILTKPNLMKKFAAMFGIEDDSLLEEFRQLGIEMMQNPPQAQGSQPGISETKPESVAGGQAGGLLNLVQG